MTSYIFHGFMFCFDVECGCFKNLKKSSPDDRGFPNAINAEGVKAPSPTCIPTSQLKRGDLKWKVPSIWTYITFQVFADLFGSLVHCTWRKDPGNEKGWTPDTSLRPSTSAFSSVLSAARVIHEHWYPKMPSSYFTEVLEKFTGSVRAETPAIDQSTEESPLLVTDDQNTLEDFVRNDPDDAIFEEYDSPFPTKTSFDWKSRRMTITTSVCQTAWVVFQLIFLGGLAIGAFGVIGFYLDITTADYCPWVPVEKLGRVWKRVRVAGQAFQVFWIEFWQFLILCTIFKWALMKELNLLTITLLGAFLDVSYRLLLHIFDAYRSPWIPYPLNVLFGGLVIYNSYAVSKRMCANANNRRAATLKLTFKLCSQFLLGLPISLFLNYFAFEWFARTPSSFKRAMIAFVVPMIAIPCKIVARLCAIHLDGVNHPGTSHSVVAVSYGVSSIVFRTLQANIESFWLFLALSVGHGIVYVFERVTVPLRDYYLDKMLLAFASCCCCDCCQRRQQKNIIRSPRSQRLTADMSIQGMIFETTALVYSIAIVYIYYMVYGVSGKKSVVFRTQIVERIPAALALEFVFNSISVFSQTRYMNIPVMRVWKRNWKKHLILATITTAMAVLYFTQYQLQLIRAEYLKVNDTLPLIGNCTEPFH